MDEVSKKRNEKFLEENKNPIFKILNFLANKDKIKNEAFIVEDLKSINRFKKLLNELYDDEIFMFTNWKTHYTLFRIENKENFFSILNDIIVQELGTSNYKVTVERLITPNYLSFSSENCKDKFELCGWDGGTITV